jgi:hypothetical protein
MLNFIGNENDKRYDKNNRSSNRLSNNKKKSSSNVDKNKSKTITNIMNKENEEAEFEEEVI